MDMPMGEMAAPESDATDGLAYVIEVYVYKDGTYRVTKESKDDEAREHAEAGTEEGHGGTDIQSTGDMLKAVLDIVKSNPAGGGEQEGFDAGFSGQEPPQSRM